MKNLILLLISFLFFIGCASKKTIVKTEKETSKTLVSVKKDSVVKITKTAEIKEAVFISVVTNNKVVDSVVNSTLKNFYTTKISGKNKYSAVYDTIKKGIKISAFIAASETKDTNIKEVKEKEKEKIVIKKEVKETKRNSFGLNLFCWLIWLIIILILAGLVYFNLGNIKTYFNKFIALFS